MPIIAKGISRRNGIAFYSHTGIAGGLLKSTITLKRRAASASKLFFRLRQYLIDLFTCLRNDHNNRLPVINP